MIKDESYYFEKASVQEAIAYMALPLMLGMCVNTLYSITDAYFIGMLNQTVMLAAVVLALPLTTLLMALGEIFGTGGGTYISRLLGEKNREDARTAAAVAFYLSLSAGFLFIACALPMLQPILQILGTDNSTAGATRDFIMILILGSPLVIGNFALEQIVRAEGASVISMNGMILSVLINILLDPVLIFFCHLNITGAAMATVVANCAAVAYYLWYLERKSPVLSGFTGRFRADLMIVKEIFSVGISAFILSMFLLISCLVLNNVAAKYGDFVVAGFGISLRVVQVSELIAMGMCMGIVPLVAYSYAARNISRMKTIIRITAISMAALILILSLFVYLFRTEVIEVFTRDPEVLSTGISILSAMLISSFFAGFSSLYINIFQATGKARQATAMSVVHGSLFIPIIYGMGVLFGLEGIIWSLAVTEILTCFIGSMMYLWLGREISREMKKANFQNMVTPNE